jgi:hypothetical protein
VVETDLKRKKTDFIQNQTLDKLSTCSIFTLSFPKYFTGQSGCPLPFELFPLAKGHGFGH